MDKRNQEAAIQQYIDMNTRHRQQAKLMQAVGSKRLQEIAKNDEPINPQTALQLISEGQRLERLSSGVSDNQTKAPSIAIIIHYDGKDQEVIDGEYTTLIEGSA
ncbi:MAG: hypothetical protein M0R06_00965 [Sphaerochaeta sp.]|jgi:hypothetical protein|nr:hypothetical protein [Sphaerochaeta sp.]